MIVRILSEGQYRLESAILDQLNQIDNRLVHAVAAGDPQTFQTLFSQLLGLVREKGAPIPTQELVESDVILPSPDTSFDEAKDLFIGDGLVPG